MATRRGPSQEATISEKHVPRTTGNSDVGPAVPTSVIVKLLGFTFAMVVVPIGSYFATVDLLFRGNATYAGALAAIMANVVLIGYIVVAMKEDQSERLEAEDKAKKSQ